MARCFLHGFMQSNYAPHLISVIDHNEEKRRYLQEQYHVETFEHISKLTHKIDIYILAVAPKDIEPLSRHFSLAKDALLISLAAGVQLQSLMEYFGNQRAIIRAMPNINAEVLCSATGLCSNSYCTENNQQDAEHLFRAIGICHWLENESHMDVFTAVLGSGPAYFFSLMEKMHHSAVALGIDPEASSTLIKQLALGSSKLTVGKKTDFTTLKRQVISEGGTTHAAMESLKENHFDATIAKAIAASIERAKALGQGNIQNKKLTHKEDK